MISRSSARGDSIDRPADRVTHFVCMVDKRAGNSFGMYGQAGPFQSCGMKLRSHFQGNTPRTFGRPPGGEAYITVPGHSFEKWFSPGDLAYLLKVFLGEYAGGKSNKDEKGRK